MLSVSRYVKNETQGSEIPTFYDISQHFVARVWAPVGNMLALLSGSLSWRNTRNFENQKIYVPQTLTSASMRPGPAETAAWQGSDTTETKRI